MTAKTGTITPAHSIRAGSMEAWAIAIRPASLLVAISPVLVGATLGFERTGSVDTIAALLVFGAALLMQVITNMQNDVGYTVRGGARHYVAKLVSRVPDARLNTPVRSVRRMRTTGQVSIGTDRGSELFDDVVLACHSD